MNINDFLTLIDQSLSTEVRSNYEMSQAIDNQILGIVHSSDPSILPMFFNYLVPETINDDLFHKERALFYLSVIFKNNCKLYGTELRQQFINLIRSLIIVPQLSDRFENYLCILEYHFLNHSTLSEDNFQEVVLEIINRLVQTNDAKLILRGAKILSYFLNSDIANFEYLTERYDIFYQLSMSFLRYGFEQAIPIQIVYGIHNLSLLFSGTHLSYEDVPVEIYQILINSASSSISWPDRNAYHSFWTSILNISSPTFFTSDFCQAFSQICIEISDNEELAPYDRCKPLETLIPVFSYYSPEQLVEILNRAIFLYTMISQEEDVTSDIEFMFFYLICKSSLISFCMFVLYFLCF